MGYIQDPGNAGLGYKPDLQWEIENYKPGTLWRDDQGVDMPSTSSATPESTLPNSSPVPSYQEMFAARGQSGPAVQATASSPATGQEAPEASAPTETAEQEAADQLAMPSTVAPTAAPATDMGGSGLLGGATPASSAPPSVLGLQQSMSNADDMAKDALAGPSAGRQGIGTRIPPSIESLLRFRAY